MVVRRPFFLLILVSFWDIRELKMSQPFSKLNKILIFPWWMVFYNQKFFSIKICRLYNPKNKRLEQTDGQFHPNISKRKVGTPIFYFIYLYFRVFSIIWKNFRKVLVFFAISHRFETKISSQNWLILYFDRDYFKEKVMRNIYFCQFYIHWTA